MDPSSIPDVAVVDERTTVLLRAWAEKVVEEHNERMMIKAEEEKLWDYIIYPGGEEDEDASEDTSEDEAVSGSVPPKSEGDTITPNIFLVIAETILAATPADIAGNISAPDDVPIDRSTVVEEDKAEEERLWDGIVYPGGEEDEEGSQNTIQGTDVVAADAWVFEEVQATTPALTSSATANLAGRPLSSRSLKRSMTDRAEVPTPVASSSRKKRRRVPDENVPPPEQQVATCQWAGCGASIVTSSVKSTKQHLTSAHNDALQSLHQQGDIVCRWPGCEGKKVWPPGPARFSSVGTLARHIHWVHIMGSRPCAYCGRNLGRADSSMRHMEKFHPELLSMPEEGSLPVKKARLA
ncbi:hypothetical protein NEOLEDRAFT_714611 [Neolentinus lepideus HHB14362 ss-1]|uniref:C2H2-type domain-containing protein n=1 Tax=Neolentinus lepideus HHB14362 ss-1 TaxID=1314782 RepID=A0A165Q4L3_9AGAM|nr:hypothetical protein NEOLEDRAFT_714611 [Neolentinus lepideus HHB14362 ss-1]